MTTQEGARHFHACTVERKSKRAELKKKKSIRADQSGNDGPDYEYGQALDILTERVTKKRKKKNYFPKNHSQPQAMAAGR